FFVNTHISSTIDKGRYLATANAPPVSLFQYHICLKLRILDCIKAVVNGWLDVSTIAPLSLITRLYSAHNGSNGIIVSHEHAVVPYGKSHKIMSTDLSGICFIPSRQSSLYILFSFIGTFLSYWYTYIVTLV